MTQFRYVIRNKRTAYKMAATGTRQSARTIKNKLSIKNYNQSYEIFDTVNSAVIR